METHFRPEIQGGQVLTKRASGILLPVFSLPGQYGIGDFGPQAYRWLDLLSEHLQTYWQVLPLNQSCGNSPYQVSSAFAGNPLLISPEVLVREGLLDRKQITHTPSGSVNKVNYTKAQEFKDRILKISFTRFRERNDLRCEFTIFCDKHKEWLEEYALFSAFKKHFSGRVWTEWPDGVKNHDPSVIKKLGDELNDSIEYERYVQFCFYSQWEALKRYAEKKNILIFGDLPFYVALDSADVWSHPEIFKLSEDKMPVKIAGVPPDMFSRTGQLWGNPVYDWEKLKKENYKWWIHRFRHNLCLFDLLRIDHFRGFEAYWEVGAGEKTARKGRWVRVPGHDFFEKLFRVIPAASLVAEDLGTITPDVTALIDAFGFSTMKVLLFAFEDSIEAADNPYLPHNHVRNSIVYTGTHDNDTARGWFSDRMTPRQRKHLFAYTGKKISESGISHELMRLAFSSVSDIAIIPLADIMNRGNEARINYPGRRKGNWRWRFQFSQIGEEDWNRLRKFTIIYGRHLQKGECA